MPFIFFFLSEYLILDHENYTLWRVMVWLHTLLFHEVCPLLRPCAKKEQLCICLVSTRPCPAHVAKFLLCKSHHHQSQTPYHRFHSSGLQTGGNLRVSESGLLSRWGKTVQYTFVMASWVFKLVYCLAFSWWSKISVGFLWDWTHTKCFLSCQHPYLGIRLTVSCLSITSTKVTPS